MRILISNDDGIDSPGLRKLAETAKEFGEVWVIAPDGQRSAMSHSFTYRESIRIWEVDYPVEGVKAYKCDGTPADCVRVGILKLLPEKPDYVMAGINSGYNISYDIQYSATIGAVMESAFMGIPSIAFSQGSVEFRDVVDHYLKQLMEETMGKPLGRNQVWNVNFPSCELKDCKGVLWNCSMSADEFYVDHYEEEAMEDGGIRLTLVQDRNWYGSEGTDLAAVLDNCISVGIVKNVDSE